MAPLFYRLTLEEFATVLDRVPFTRRVNGVHLHHTWRPNQDEYRGQDTLASIWRHHTEVNGWSAIGQHATIAPDGVIWSGRSWNCPPVSASGNNGNRAFGPFSLALVGDFGHGRDRLEGEQRRVAVQLVALLQRKFGLDAGSMQFHSHLSRTSCPGASIDHRLLLDEVRAARAALGDTPSGAAPERGAESAPFGDNALELSAVIEAVSAAPPAKDDPPDAEPHEDALSDVELRALFRGGSDAALSGEGAGEMVAGEQAGPSGGRTLWIATPPPLPAEILNSLRPHVVNLNAGQLSGDGQLSTTPGDVDAIFDEYLVRALEGAQARKEPLRVLFYAHGGLTSESQGLRVAEKHVGWWRRNNVYPIYFVWETGLFETIGQMLQRAQAALRGATRDIFDFTSDPLIEAAVRALYAPQVWSGMKRSAELAVARDGGAYYVAQKLKAFCDRHKDAQVELHAAGHSAGAIFQSHFLSAAHALKTPSFRTLHLLAPAINAETFRERLADRLGQGNGVDHLTVFTMNDAAERDDNCNGIYRKSLLYLIYYALERSPKTPILGLETCLRNDRAIRDLLGLGGVRSDKGEVILSPTISTTGRSASQAVRHGTFDDDAPTLNSMARRVLGADDNDPIVEFPTGGAQRGVDSWSGQVDWPAELAYLVTGKATGGGSGPPAAAHGSAPAPAAALGGSPSGAAQPVAVPAAIRPGGSIGRRRALCVGINEYPTAPLYGCVADAQEWRSALGNIGFDDVKLLTNRDATRQAILDSLRGLVMSSAAGDVIVFQFAGHGTQLPDLGGDETTSDTPGLDEAICAFDFADGAFVIDDDIGEIFERIPRGVNVTCFIDCCHSGTISRFGVGAPPVPGAARGAEQGPRPRFIVATPQIVEAHRRFREARGARRAAGARGLTLMKEVVFSACLSSEVAYESAGHGDFTSRAVRLLRSGVALSNEQFEDGVVAEFGAGARQHPRLYCHPDARSLRLLEPLTTPVGTYASAGVQTTNRTPPASMQNGQAGNTAQLLHLVASLVEGRS